AGTRKRRTLWIELPPIDSLENRVDDPATAMRSRKLRLFGSIDDNDWMELYTRAEDRPFGGVDGYPLTIDLKNSHIRYIKIDLDDENYLHLDKIEVYI
ncbi:hypothetical protein ACFQDP_03105, partial [Methylorubrum zatmanii]